MTLHLWQTGKPGAWFKRPKQKIFWGLACKSSHQMQLKIVEHFNWFPLSSSLKFRFKEITLYFIMQNYHNRQGRQCRGATVCAGIMFLDASICLQFNPLTTSQSVQNPLLCYEGVRQLWRRPLSTFCLRLPIHPKPQNASNTQWLGTIPQLHWILSASARNEPDRTYNSERLPDVYPSHTQESSRLWPSKRSFKAKREIRGRLCES